jgi:hypothetical protein
MNQTSGGRGTGMAIGVGLIAGLLVLVAAAVFLGIYLGLPEFDHFYALLLIGILSLILSVGAYFSQALTRDPVVQRGATLGFLGMGFVVLFLTVAFDPAGGTVMFLPRLAGLIVLTLLLVVAIAGILWRARGRMADASRQERRSEWAQKPAASAFDYSAAQAVAPTSTGPSQSPPSSPPGR